VRRAYEGLYDSCPRLDAGSFGIGHCAQDRTRIGNITVGAETPQFAHAALRALASDWRVSGILNARSGRWLTVTTGRDIAGTGIQNQRVSEVKDSPYGDKTLQNYLTPTAFAYPDAGTLGNHKRGSIDGPGYWTIAMAISRMVAFTTQQNVELRFEVFDLLNNFNWGDPGTNLDAATLARSCPRPETRASCSSVLSTGYKLAEGTEETDFTGGTETRRTHGGRLHANAGKRSRHAGDRAARDMDRPTPRSQARVARYWLVSGALVLSICGP